tara:strand:- start:1813 stop:2517 length:705 start_codon:yes stop_codon:yes gene_type:complete
MPLTTAQLTTLKAAILAETDAGFVAARNAKNENLMAAFYNAPASPAFVVWKPSVPTAAIGTTIGYVALAAMTSANLTQLDMFTKLNPQSFPPTASIRAFFTTTFSGALGGEGQSTRDALDALYRRTANRLEKLFATGTGSVASPATLVVEGELAPQQISWLLFAQPTTWAGVVTTKEIRNGMVYAAITYTSSAGPTRVETTFGDDLTAARIADLIATRVESLQRADAALAQLGG